MKLPYRYLVLSALVVVTAVGMTSCQSFPYADSPQAGQSAFGNTRPRQAPGFVKTFNIYWDFLFNKGEDTVPSEALPVQIVTQEMLSAAPDGSLYRLGHSTVLLKLHGHYFLTDPVFSERVSPVQWIGPKRFHAPPIALEDLPVIKAVILSHDHYDHLDYETLLALADKAEWFIAPLGVGDRLIDWGIDAHKVKQHDWWQFTDIAGVRFIATPAQHFSGRGLLDRNKTLWASWVIIDDDLRIFFSGDTGYFNGFKTIGEKYGPFDITLIECGAYDMKWSDIHMQPEDVIKAHEDLRGRWLLPIHNGTFDLAMHTWYEPFDRIVALAKNQGVALTTPRMGEILSLQAPHVASQWWRQMINEPVQQENASIMAME